MAAGALDDEAEVDGTLQLLAGAAGEQEGGGGDESKRAAHGNPESLNKTKS